MEDGADVAGIALMGAMDSAILGRNPSAKIPVLIGEADVIKTSSHLWKR